MATGRISLSDQVRDAVERSGLTRYRIAQETGIAESTLSRFVRGLQGLSTEHVDQLGELLGLRIVASGRRRSSGRVRRAVARTRT